MSQRKNEIDEALGIIAPLLQESEPGKGAAEAVVVLVGGALLDLARIADAVAKLSEFELTKIGELLHIGGPDITDEERETIEALRRGDVRVVTVVRDPNTDPKEDGPIAWLEINKLGDGDGMPPIDPDCRVDLWGANKDGPHERGGWRGRAREADWANPLYTHWRPALAWHDWDGSTKEGPDVPAGCVVDIKFRATRPEHDEMRLAVRPNEYNWKNEGRPNNADIVGWRVSAANWINFYLDYQATLTNMKAQAAEATAKG